MSPSALLSASLSSSRSTSVASMPRVLRKRASVPVSSVSPLRGSTHAACGDNVAWAREVRAARSSGHGAGWRARG
eukprot:1261980-Prymnesium_polylepis.1